jgi:hypothetical protein
MKKRPQSLGLSLGYHTQFAAMTPPQVDRSSRNLGESRSADSPVVTTNRGGSESLALARRGPIDRVEANHR